MRTVQERKRGVVEERRKKSKRGERIRREQKEFEESRKTSVEDENVEVWKSGREEAEKRRIEGTVCKWKGKCSRNLST
jgi:hypothetical protein